MTTTFKCRLNTSWSRLNTKGRLKLSNESQGREGNLSSLFFCIFRIKMLFLERYTLIKSTNMLI
ncbi:hypothetical protein CIK44_19960 [Bacillus sp. X2(2017)]|nr:hypothetical protein CIK44_19960 [Bacillus sp. X2(2017)]